MPDSGAARGVAIGSLILAIFGAVWLMLAAFYAGRLNWKSVLLVLAGGAALALGAVRHVPAAGLAAANAKSAEAGRIVAYASAVEGVAIFIAVVVLKRRAPTYIMTAIAIIVGVHFIPLALGLGFWLYWITGAVMVAFAIALGFVCDDRSRQWATCLATGLNLWITALVLRILPIA